jgi:hypothetical protein
MRKATTILLSLAAVLAIGCGAAPKKENTVTPASAGASAATAATTAGAAAGPTRLNVGQAGNVTTRDGTGTAVVSKVAVQGKSIVATVTISCTTGQMDYNPFDWAMLAGDGTSLEAAFDPEVKNLLHSGTIGAGQKVTGAVPFQGTAAQAKGAQVQLSIGFETSAYWVNG